MGVARFLRSNAGLLAAMVIATALTDWIMTVSGLGPSLIVLVDVVVWFCLVAALVARYLKTRRFWSYMEREFGGSCDDAFSAVRMAPAPNDAHAEITQEALQCVEAQAYGKIQELASERDRYQTYIETWIHEVKTPIATAGLVLANNPGPMAQEVSEELERIEGYVEQALFFSRSRAVDRDYVVKTVDVREMVMTAVKSRKHMLVNAHVGIELDVSGTVITDPKWVVFMLGQLLDNSVKYVAPGRDAKVRITGEVVDEGSAREAYLLHVEDNGIGVAPADLGRVFDMGFVGNNGRQNRKATGVGLYLVKTLADKLGIEVTIASDGVSFTEVTMAFPMNMMHHVEAVS